jgi:hypothetical protein
MNLLIKADIGFTLEICGGCSQGPCGSDDALESIGVKENGSVGFWQCFGWMAWCPVDYDDGAMLFS